MRACVRAGALLICGVFYSCLFIHLHSLSPPGGNGSSSGNLSTSSANVNACNTNQRRRKGSVSSDETTSEESMDSDGDSNSVSRDISPTNERTTYAVNKVQNDQDVDDNTIIIIDDSPDDEPVRAPLVCTQNIRYVLSNSNKINSFNSKF